MKNINIVAALIRIFPFVLFSFWCYDLYQAYYNPEIISNLYCVFGSSLTTTAMLWLITEQFTRINCCYIRTLYGSMTISMIISIINFQFKLVNNAKSYLYILIIIMVITILILFYLSILHFYKFFSTRS